MRRRRRMTLHPSKGMITASRVFAGVFALVGLAFVALGVTTVIPSGAGLFGIVWTLMACVFVGVGVYGACNKRGMYFMYEWQIDEEEEGTPPNASNAQERLCQLQSLREQGMVSDTEYEDKRKEILKDL